MNTTNILLGTTSALLVVGFALSFDGFSKNKDSDESAMARKVLKAEIAKADREAQELRLSQLRASADYTPPSVIPPMPTITPPAPAPDAPADAALLEKLESEKEKSERLAAEKSDLEEQLKVSEKETEEAYKDKKRIKEEQEERAKKVRMALTMGTVTNASKETALVIFEPTDTANFQPGKVLNVRRNDGIIGQIEVDRLQDNLYICTMRPHGYSPDGYPDIQPGDEVIIDHGDR